MNAYETKIWMKLSEMKWHEMKWNEVNEVNEWISE